tara:strand:- start:388 stop:1137 length:750 start_codon:yes stop_codon:yes gene_type:complete
MPDERTEQDGGDAQAAQGFSLRRMWPLAILLLGLAAFFAFDGPRYFSCEALQSHRGTLTGWVTDNFIGAALGYMAVYAVVVAFSLPGGAVMSMLGGFMFGRFAGTGLIVVGATVGATILFIAAKTAIGDALRARAGPSIRKMEAGFQENAFNYLLVLRLIPLFPFFLVNLVPAFLGVKLRTYVVATFFGIMPGSFVYAQVGTGLGSLLQSCETFSVSGILTPDIIAALVGLALLSLLPVLYKTYRARKS